MSIFVLHFIAKGFHRNVRYWSFKSFSDLQIIVGGVASTPQDVGLYASCSLLAASMKCNGKKESNEEANKGAIEACVEWLMDNEFISIQKDGQGTAI